MGRPSTFLAVVSLGLAALPAAGPQGAFPWKPGDAPPTVAGVPLGASRGRLDSLLGKADRLQPLGPGATALFFSARGVSVVYSTADGAAVIYLLRRDAGDIGGVRLGDANDSVLAKWGPPSDAAEGTALYTAGGWAVVVGVDSIGKAVVQLGLGRRAN